MKTKFIMGIVGLLSLTISLRAQQVAEASGMNQAQIHWETTTQDVGQVMQNVPVEIIYVYKNTGDVPLIIESIKTSCGCTAGKFSKEPLLPGEKSEVRITYNARSHGKFRKTVTVYSNVPGKPELLTLEGEVAGS